MFHFVHMMPFMNLILFCGRFNLLFMLLLLFDNNFFLLITLSFSLSTCI